MDAEASLQLKDIPRRLLIVGAGYIGLEMAVIYKSLGSDIAIAEFTPDILPGADQDLRDVLKKEMTDLMEKAMFDTRVTSIVRKRKELHAEFESGNGKKKQYVFDKALVAIGSKPNTSGIGLEEAGIKVDDKGFIPVDIFRRTNVENIYAIGDITGQPMLAHKATFEGRVAAEHIAGLKTAYEPRAIPAIIYTDPEIAWAGLTENDAKREGRAFDVVKYPWSVSGRALTMGIKNGLTKLIIEKGTERLLGAGIAGKDAGSLLPEIMLALEMSAVVRDLELTIHPHPTLSETIMEAAELYYGQATHLFKKSRQSKLH
jgi:dihydrolipoamide dehydrogenase